MPLELKQKAFDAYIDKAMDLKIVLNQINKHDPGEDTTLLIFNSKKIDSIEDKEIMAKIARLQAMFNPENIIYCVKDPDDPGVPILNKDNMLLITKSNNDAMQLFSKRKLKNKNLAQACNDAGDVIIVGPNFSDVINVAKYLAGFDKSVIFKIIAKYIIPMDFTSWLDSDVNIEDFCSSLEDVGVQAIEPLSPYPFVSSDFNETYKPQRCYTPSFTMLASLGFVGLVIAAAATQENYFSMKLHS